MPMNKARGNMYPWVTHTWNPVRGKCPHQCTYCYMRKYWNKLGNLRLIEKEFKTNLGEGNIIFVGSSIDMFAESIPENWIIRVLGYCKKFENEYLFQSKNPERFFDFIDYFPKNTILGTTIETNRDYGLTNAPNPFQRTVAMVEINDWVHKFKRMISIEPIMDFDLDNLVDMIWRINPKFVSIGADSKNHNLPEPSKEKIEKLIKELREFTEVKVKSNLERIV